MKIKLSSVTVTWEINLIQFQQLECNTQLLKQKQKKIVILYGFEFMN